MTMSADLSSNRSSSRRPLRFAVGLCAALSLSPSARAVPLPSGGSVTLSGVTVAGPPSPLAGTTHEDGFYDVTCSHLDKATKISRTFMGRIQLNVQDVAHPPPQPLTYDFYYRAWNLGGDFRLESVSLSGFATYGVDVNWRSDGMGSIPVHAAWRSIDSNEVTFSFPGFGMDPDPLHESRFFFIHTNATDYSHPVHSARVRFNLTAITDGSVHHTCDLYLGYTPTAT